MTQFQIRLPWRWSSRAGAAFHAPPDQHLLGKRRQHTARCALCCEYTASRSAGRRTGRLHRLQPANSTLAARRLQSLRQVQPQLTRADLGFLILQQIREALDKLRLLSLGAIRRSSTAVRRRAWPPFLSCAGAPDRRMPHRARPRRRRCWLDLWRLPVRAQWLPSAACHTRRFLNISYCRCPLASIDAVCAFASETVTPIVSAICLVVARPPRYAIASR